MWKYVREEKNALSLYVKIKRGGAYGSERFAELYWEIYTRRFLLLYHRSVPCIRQNAKMDKNNWDDGRRRSNIPPQKETNGKSLVFPPSPFSIPKTVHLLNNEL